MMTLLPQERISSGCTASCSKQMNAMGKGDLQVATRAMSLPYSSPNLPEWKDGDQRDIGDRVMVIREVPPPPYAVTDAKPTHVFAQLMEPITCSSRIPKGMSLKDVLKDHAATRAYSRLCKIPIIMEVYERKQVVLTDEKGAKSKEFQPVLVETKRLLVTRGARRTTVRESVRDRNWYDARDRRPINKDDKKAN